MQNLRKWEITPDAPFGLTLAADARLCETSYADDQSWDVLVGAGDRPALALQTQYGWRVGLASLIPMWQHGDRVIYQARTYHSPPQITAFAPNYIAIETDILPNLSLHAQHMAFTSQVIGGLYTLTNRSSQPISLRFELFGHVGAQGREQKLAIVSMSGGGHALALGTHAQFAPLAMIENGTASSLSGRSASPKIGIDLTIEADESLSVRFVHAGMSDVRSSLATARRWLAADWQPFLSSIDAAAAAIPIIQTSNTDWDLVLASSYNRVVQAFLRPTGHFPAPTFVAGRVPEYGYSKRGDGRDHPRLWEGQQPDTAYLIAPVMATIAPEMAQGVIRNYIAMQHDDGFIDLTPGAAGQREDMLCTPVLARLAWTIYEQSGDEAFLMEVQPALRKFFDYWMRKSDSHRDLPTWQAEQQTRYLAFPTFGIGREWAQGAAIHTIETPDLIAYLLAEADALMKMIWITGAGDDIEALVDQYETLQAALESLWDGERYTYRDRDSDVTTGGQTLLEDGSGDATHALDQGLLVPNRLIITIEGGVSHVPTITLTVSGRDSDGNAVTETASTADFWWQNRCGRYTTNTVFSHVDVLRVDGLSRVYQVHAQTVDSTDLDLNAVLPLMTDSIDPDHATQLAKLVLDTAHFRQPHGITMTSATSSTFDPSNEDGAGGIWMYWQTLIGEGLLAAGHGDDASDIVKDQLKFLVETLARTHEFSQFYHSTDVRGLGEKGHINGIAPLYLMQRLVGVRVMNAGRVWLAQDFAWGRAITVRQHGVYVRRTTKRIKVEFPSGTVIELDPTLADDLLVVDPDAQDTAEIMPITLPRDVKAAIPDPQPPTTSTQRVIIEVEQEE